MGNLFSELHKRADVNARHEVDVYTQSLPDYSALERDTRARADTLEYAVWFRRRTVELAADDCPLTGQDLDFIASIGEQRGTQGVSPASPQRVLTLHTSLMLREIHEATGPDDIDELMRLMSWLGPQGTAGSKAYIGGFTEGQRQHLSFGARVQSLTRTLLADQPMAPDLMSGVGMRLHAHYTVLVVRVPGRPGTSAERRDEVVETLLKRHRMPLTWHEPDELVALVPGDGGEPVCTGTGRGMAEPEERALSLARDVAEAVGRPCATGTSTGRTQALAGALARARRVGRVAPLRNVPRRTYALPDVFVELGVSRLPEVDDWLCDVARRLAPGPDLVTTLDAYYVNDMNRLLTAASLHIHPRTLDYRLQRVRDLSGIDPSATRGIRILSAVVTRALAGAWHEAALR